MNVLELIDSNEKKLSKEFALVDEIERFNSNKVLSSFINNDITEGCFNQTTGYGYDDFGRDKIEKVFSEIFKAESSLVRNQFVSGSHALTVCLFALLRPGDVMLSITGEPYDTLHEVIGIKNNPSSLKSFGIKYEQVDLKGDDFDIEKIVLRLKRNKVKLIEIQRSKGYSTRESITISKLSNVITKIREVDSDVIIMVDNCYCELVSYKEPIEVGADICVGSLIKNLGGGLASNGAYITGKKSLVDLCGERLTLPGEGKDVGPSLGANRLILQGLFMAPFVVASSLKVAILTSKVMEDLNYKVSPKYSDERADIVQNIIFEDKEKLIKYCQGIQASSPIDANAVPVPWDMPGYDDKVIMAAGTFTQGSSIELSCDGPLRAPFIAYQQGSLTYEYGRLGLIGAIKNLETDFK